MRVLLSSTRGAGHFNPLVPFGRAFERAGHEVLAAGSPFLTDTARAAGFEIREFDAPPEDELDAVWSRVPELPREEQERTVVGDIFGRLNTTAALPGLRALCEEWSPDLILREPNEYGSALAAELYGIPHARVAIGLSSTEESGIALAAGPVDDIRRAAGLPPDPDGERLRVSPYLSVFAPALDDGEQPDTHRFRDPAWDEPAAALPAWWPGREQDPLVYVTFGSVAGSVPFAAPIFGAALAAVEGLEARVLLTVGRELDRDALPPAPDNVRVEAWVPQQDVLAHADAMVCHGGSGSTLGGLAAGLPMVVVPLFADQPQNARRVAEVGAGVDVVPDPGAPEATVAAMREAIETVLAKPSFRERAEALAADARAQPPVDDAVALFESRARS